MVLAWRAPAPHAGLVRMNSGRAMQTKRIGAPRDWSVTWSSRSSSAGSAHWASSTTTTTGASRASRSSRRRKAQTISPLDAAVAWPRIVSSPLAISWACSTPASRVVHDGWSDSTSGWSISATGQ